jgi:GAF domain-containing protein
VTEISNGGNYGGRYDVKRPPELDGGMAVRRLADVNRLLHSLVVLHSDLRERRTLTHVIRSARALVGASRGLLRVRDLAGTACGLRADLGFSREHRPVLAEAQRMACASLISRKPLIVSNPPEAELSAELRAMGDGSCLTIPVLPAGEPWGVLQLLREEPFQEEDAILVWIYVMVLEEALRDLPRPGHPAPAEDAEDSSGLLGSWEFRRRLDEEIERSLWSGRPLSVLRLAAGVGEPENQESEALLRRALVVVRRSLRPGIPLGRSEDGGILLLVRGAGAPEARRCLQSLRRNLAQSRALGDGHQALLGLSLHSASFPQDGRSREELLESLGRAEEDAAAGAVS